MEFKDIRLGDTVRLRNGETFVVGSKITSYHDRDGDHEGPFLAPDRPFTDRYALGDVVEVIERNSRICIFCGEGVTSREPDVLYCRGCHYTGRAHEEQREDLLLKLRLTPNVEDASIWHTGGGCFLLAVNLTDGRLVAITDGDAGLPEQDEKWGLVVISPDQDAWDEWDEDRLDIRYGEWDDAQLTAAVAKIAATPTEDKVVSLDGERQYREELASGRDPRD